MRSPRRLVRWTQDSAGAPRGDATVAEFGTCLRRQVTPLAAPTPSLLAYRASDVKEIPRAAGTANVGSASELGKELPGAMPSRAPARVGKLRRGEMPACLPDAVRRESMAHGLFDFFPSDSADADGTANVEFTRALRGFLASEFSVVQAFMRIYAGEIRRE